MARKGRRSNQQVFRDKIISQLREELALCEQNMNSQEVSLQDRQHWAQTLTNAAQVLNTILRDDQFYEWEKRMRILEKQGLISPTDLTGSEP